jgi:hypothetical protein
MNDDECIEKEIAGIVKLMRRDFPKAADWNAQDDGTYEILDRNDKRLAVITERQLTRYWNIAEGSR